MARKPGAYTRARTRTREENERMRHKTQFRNDNGLLWYDDNPGRDLADKVTQGARRYRKKYGEAATLCYVHPAALSGDAPAVKMAGEVRVKPLPTVLVHHLWLGVEEKKDGRN